MAREFASHGIILNCIIQIGVAHQQILSGSKEIVFKQK